MPRKNQSVRPVRDRQLTPPFDSWIDRSVPLPSDVRLLPRTIETVAQWFVMIYVGGGLLAMVVFAMVMFRQSGAPTEPCALISVGLFCAVPLGVIYLMSRGLWSTMGARRDERLGQLRQGILIGRAGLLVRLENNECYPIRLDRFVKAKSVVEGDEDQTLYLVIETRDGPVKIGNQWVHASPEQINQLVKDVRQNR